jgi:hypothetical protein
VNPRKPHAGNAGYVCERRARLGGHLVVYDRNSGFEIDAGERWILMHEPSGRHVAMPTEGAARETMKALAEARTLHEARLVADLFPAADATIDAVDEEPAAETTAGSRRQLEALERFWKAETFEEERAAWLDVVDASPVKRGGRS